MSGDNPEGQLSLALLTGNIELAVDLCVQQARWSDALILAAQVGLWMMSGTTDFSFLFFRI